MEIIISITWTKLHIFSTNVKSVLLYVNETLNHNTTIINKLKSSWTDVLEEFWTSFGQIT
jgi:hypothetical protein